MGRALGDGDEWGEGWGMGMNGEGSSDWNEWGGGWWMVDEW